MYYSMVCDVGSRINHRSVFLGGILTEFLSSCLPNIYALKLSTFAMIFMSLRGIKVTVGEQLSYSYCGLHQSAADRKAELAPYSTAQCICSSCVNSTPETDNICKTFPPRVMEYNRKSLSGSDSGRFPQGP
jgi:hypothetical protein